MRVGGAIINLNNRHWPRGVTVTAPSLHRHCTVTCTVTVPLLTTIMIVEALPSVRVVSVAAGDKHSILCTAEGEVLTCGHGAGGKLGHGDTQDVHVPRMVMGLAGKAVVAVAANDRHSLALTVDGDVFSFGQGKGLGHEDVMKEVWTVLCERSMIEYS